MSRHFALGPLCGVLDLRHGWARLFGWGVAWRDNRRHGPLFSERNGRRRVLHVGPYSLRVLPPTFTGSPP